MAWDELTVEIESEIDTDIDKMIKIGQEGYYQGLAGLGFQIKKSLERATEKATYDLAKHNRSYQQRLITDISQHPYASGVLGSSIVTEKKGQYRYLIGTRINHIYPMSVEKGRRGFSAQNAQALAFYSLSGELIFRKSVGPAKPRPFVQPAYEATSKIAEKVVESLIEKELSAFR